MEIITTHLNADFDALASMVAAKKLYPHAVLVFPGSQEKGVRDFLEVSHLKLDLKRLKDIDLKDVRTLILVDVKSPQRIGQLSDVLKNKDIKVHIYDHHPQTGEDIKGSKEIIEPVGATTTLFTEILQHKRIRITHEEATIFALGIYEETGSLTFPTTTPRDVMAVAYLLRKGANLKVISSFIIRELRAEEIELLNELIHSSRDYVIHDVRVKMATASREGYIGDVAYLAHKLRDIEDVDVIFLILMMEDRVHIIGRSHVPEVDVYEILREFGGGGHRAASYAVVRNISIEEVEERIISLLKDKIRPVKTARDIMTSPVKCISWDDTITSAEKTMTRYGVNVLPVIKDNIYKGIISREVVEKAIFHGFSKSKVSEFCSTDVSTVNPLTPTSEVETLMIEQNQRFMPVIEGERIVGAITRTDLLRSLYESLLRKRMITSKETLAEKPSIGKNLNSLMMEKFPDEIYNLLRLCGEVAKELNFYAYLVGGSVRDLIRGEANLDIDIVIEGDGIAFAKELGKRLNARVSSHERFGTAVVITDFLKFDVATARTEYYETPAALPRVEMSSIKKDLYRRDFTINTMAIRLNPEGFGQLIDFFGGQRDIKDKTIRVLHNLSFIEDPTRAFRAIRFSERFGFKLSKHTVNLIKTAVSMNLFDRLSGSRLYDELSLLFMEVEPVKAIKRLSELDLLKFIHPDIRLTQGLEETFRAIEETISWFRLQFFEDSINIPNLYLMALLDQLKKEDRKRLLHRLSVPDGEMEEMLRGVEESRSVLSELRGSPDNKKIYYALKPLGIQTILFTMAKARDEGQKKAISLYLTRIRNIKPDLTGDDLKGMGYAPGPAFKKILSSILDERLDGRIKTRTDEIEFVRKRFPISHQLQ
ncbi:MAG: CBS domain-containing protein [Thermodesulfovibrionia bacterium]